MKTVTLNKGQEKRLKGGHPWVYRNEIAPSPEAVEDGAAVEITDSKGRLLGFGQFAADGTIAVRVLPHSHKRFDAAFFAARFAAAREHRLWLGHDLAACRLVHSEGDGLSGLVMDAFGDGLVVQLGSTGMRLCLPAIIEAARQVFKPKWMVESGGSALHGKPPEHAEFKENGARFFVQPGKGQKTGWFLDQKANRREALRWAKGATVLDLFCYQGALAIQAALAGASRVVALDSSEPDLALAKEHAKANGVEGKIEWIAANAFDWLKAHEKDGLDFDLVWLDPPAFTKSRAAIPAASRGYKEVNLRSLKRIKPGGVLATSSCSHHMAPGLFRDIVAQASVDAGRTLRLIAERTQDTDHVIDPSVRETQYLKCLLLRAGD